MNEWESQQILTISWKFQSKKNTRIERIEPTEAWLADSHWFNRLNCFLLRDSCLDKRYEAFKPQTNHFWWDLKFLGLGFEDEERTARKRRKEREMLQKNEGSGPVYLLYRVQTGSVQNRPIFFHPWPLDLGLVNPDQSNALKAFWRSGSTSVWVGLVSVGLFVLFLAVYCFLCYSHLYFCYLNPCTY